MEEDAARHEAAKHAAQRKVAVEQARRRAEVERAAQAKAGTTSGFQTLVGRVGDDVYCDFNGWNLYLRDTKFSQALCQVLADKAKDGELSRSELDDVLKGVPLKLGAGKVTVALYDVLPARCVDDLEALLALYAEDRL